MWNKNVINFIGCDKQFCDADIVLFGAPFDGTTSFKAGARFGSSAIRNESFGIETYSPYQDKDLEDVNVYDMGDLEFPFGNPNKVLDIIQSTVGEILKSDKLPIMIGGEHLVTLGSVRAVQQKYPDLHIVHFDAHADLRDDYLGEKFSHATVIRRCYDIVGEQRIFQFGIRSGERAEFEFAKKHTQMHKFNLDGVENLVHTLKGKKVYFTLDLDVLDPSLFCGTGTPEAGGVLFEQLIDAFKIIGQLDIVGCDINELAPMYDNSGVSTAVACKTLRELILAINK